MRIFFSICCICIFTIVVVSCSDDTTTESYTVGTNFVNTNINLKAIDTFSIKAGTFKLDSVVTSSTNRMLIGSVTDDYLGKLTSQTYAQIYNSNFSISNDAVYDSIGFVLYYDNYYFGDTTKVQTYKIHRVLETVKPKEGNYFYNTSSLEYDSETLGEITFTPRPNQTDSLYIPINNELGKEIFEKIKDNDINTSDDFIQFFKGITIVPDTTVDSHILGFKFQSSTNTVSSSYMRLFFTEKDDDNQNNDKTIDFYIPSSDKQFNTITPNFESTILNGLIEDSETIVSSEQTNNLIFVQAGSGMSARIEIPSLKKLNEATGESTALSSNLTFSPLNKSYNNNAPLQDSLAVYIIDKKNRIVSQLTDIDGNTSYAILNNEADEFEQNTYYTVDMSGFVETILRSTYNLDYAIMIQFLNYNKTIDRAVINDKGDKKIKLTVNYLNY